MFHSHYIGLIHLGINNQTPTRFQTLGNGGLVLPILKRGAQKAVCKQIRVSNRPKCCEGSAKGADRRTGTVHMAAGEGLAEESLIGPFSFHSSVIGVRGGMKGKNPAFLGVKPQGQRLGRDLMAGPLG